MQLHPKKRIEIIVELPIVKRLLARLDETDATGYSVLSVIAGRGQNGAWTAQGQVSDVGQMMAIICILDPGKLDDVLGVVFSAIERQIGLVTVSDVAVVRNDRF